MNELGETFQPATPGHRRAGSPAPATTVLARRLAMAGTYAGLTVLLVRTVASQIAPVEEALTNLGRVLPDALQGLGPEPASLALFLIGVAALVLAGGTFLVSRDTGAAFGLLSVGTVAWFLFPYSEIPWTAAFTDHSQMQLKPTASVWVLAALIVAVATIEVLLSARDTLVDQLVERGLPGGMVRQARTRTRTGTLGLLAASLAAGSLVAVAYAVFREPLSRGLIPEPNLIWVPAGLGLAAGLAVYLASRQP